MSADRDINRVVRSWLHEERHEDADRVLGAALDQVDTTPQRRSTLWTAWRDSPMNKFVAIGLGAAAVVVALFIGAQLVGQPNVVAPPIRDTIAKSCRRLPAEPAGPPELRWDLTGRGSRLEPGPSICLPTSTSLRVIVTVPAGWEKNQARLGDLVLGGTTKATLALSNVDDLYIDPCQPELLHLRDPKRWTDRGRPGLGSGHGSRLYVLRPERCNDLDGSRRPVPRIRVGVAECRLPRGTALVGGRMVRVLRPAPIGDDELGIWIMDRLGPGDPTRTDYSAYKIPVVPGPLRVAELDEIIGFDADRVKPL